MALPSKPNIHFNPTRLAWIPFALVVGIAMIAMLYRGGAEAQTAPTLGSAESFAVLGGSTVTNTGATTVWGDLGVSPGTAVTGFPPGIVNGTIHINDGPAQAAQLGVSAAFTALDQPCTADLTGQDLGGMTLTEGVYCFSSSAQLTGTLTLDGEGNADSVFIFKMGSTLTTANAASVEFINGAEACNVFWRVGSSATLGTTTSFAGNILALASITLNTGAQVDGRVLAQTGAVTMDSNTVDARECGVAAPTATSTGTTQPGETGTAIPTGTTPPGETGTAIPTGTSQPGETETVQPGQTETVQPGQTETVQPGQTETVQPGQTETVQPGATGTTQPGATSTAQAATSTAQAATSTAQAATSTAQAGATGTPGAPSVGTGQGPGGHSWTLALLLIGAGALAASLGTGALVTRNRR